VEQYAEKRIGENMSELQIRDEGEEEKLLENN